MYWQPFVRPSYDDFIVFKQEVIQWCQFIYLYLSMWITQCRVKKKNASNPNTKYIYIYIYIFFFFSFCEEPKYKCILLSKPFTENGLRYQKWAFKRCYHTIHVIMYNTISQHAAKICIVSYILKCKTYL